MNYFVFLVSELLAALLWREPDDLAKALAVLIGVLGVMLLFLLREPKRVHAKRGLDTAKNTPTRPATYAEPEWFGYPPPPGVYAEFCEQIREALDGQLASGDLCPRSGRERQEAASSEG